MIFCLFKCLKITFLFRRPVIAIYGTTRYVAYTDFICYENVKFFALLFHFYFYNQLWKHTFLTNFHGKDNIKWICRIVVVKMSVMHLDTFFFQVLAVLTFRHSRKASEACMLCNAAELYTVRVLWYFFFENLKKPAHHCPSGIFLDKILNLS